MTDNVWNQARCIFLLLLCNILDRSNAHLEFLQNAKPQVEPRQALTNIDKAGISRGIMIHVNSSVESIVPYLCTTWFEFVQCTIPGMVEAAMDEKGGHMR